MSPKSDPTKVAERASTVIAHQLDAMIESGPRGIANAFGMLASMVGAVADRAADTPAAWAYFRRVLDHAEKAGIEVTRRLDAGEIEVDDLAKMAKPEGEA